MSNDDKTVEILLPESNSNFNSNTATLRVDSPASPDLLAKKLTGLSDSSQRQPLTEIPAAIGVAPLQVSLAQTLKWEIKNDVSLRFLAALAILVLSLLVF